MDFLRIAAFGIVSAVLCLLLKQYRPEYAAVAAAVCGVFLLMGILDAMEPVFAALDELIGQTGVSSDYLQAVLKALGICYTAQLASDTCRDAGQTAIAAKIELAGRTAVLVLALPMFMEVAQTAVGLLRQD